MTSTLVQRWGTAAVAAVCPLLAILAVSTIGPVAGPSSARAADAAAGAAPEVPLAAPATPAQVAAGRYAETRRVGAGSPTPFVHTDSAATLTPAAAHPHPAPAPALEPVPEFKLTAITSGGQTVAVINGKVRRLGDELAGGWVVSEIDAESGTVVLTYPGREAVTIALRPGLQTR